MKARDFVLEAFHRYGARYVFGNPGTTELPLMDGLAARNDIEYILALHEDIAVGMAAGYAQVTGRPAVVNLHVAPGLAHGLGNLYDAWRAGVPLVVTTGQHDSRLALQEPALAGDLVRMAEPFTKWAYEVRRAQELPLALHRAFKTAMTEPTGPVFLALPSDVMLDEVEGEPWPLTTVVQGGRPEPGIVRRIAEWLVAAERPVLIVGDRAGRTGAIPALVRLADALAIPVYTEHQSSGLGFPSRHPLWFGRCLPNGPFYRRLFADRDVVVWFGVTSQAPLLFDPLPMLPPSTRVVHVDVDPWEIAKNRPADLALQADLAGAAEAIAEAVEARMEADASARARVRERRRAVEGERRRRDRQREEEADAGRTQWPLSSAHVASVLGGLLPEDAIVVDESVTNGRFVHGYLPVSNPRGLIALKGGGLGYGLPAALGAQLAAPGRTVVACIGDGSALYYIQALWTAVKYRLPVRFFIFNNASYMILKGGLKRMGGPAAQQGVYPGMDLIPEVDFVAIARAFGVEALRVEDPADVGTAVARALSADGPVLVDVAIDREVKPYLE
ncbi:thiamine pyrophosphate-binding protein [Alicyclobacillus sp.]|uniref:thiamine pyrophosphate-binding protein n=1 Tax=Alicyclobacillus sp. TaxID=61169 RepID=UPI0025C36084|nr:thiamine pyrophosphate-binding protein [Alicyclobacillus sp.]MCL6517769.1 thiamine pyrophosphate-binding protein [Alicyclobacillus sp.]